MATRIQLRRDTAANFTSANPTLAAGELAYETDSRKIKAGDGSTAWTSLNYIIDPAQAAAISDIHSDLSPELAAALGANNQNIGAVNEFTGNSVQANTFTSNGTFTANGHILPAVTNTYDIGSADYKVRHLFLGDNSLYIGNHAIRPNENGDFQNAKRDRSGGDPHVNLVQIPAGSGAGATRTFTTATDGNSITNATAIFGSLDVGKLFSFVGKADDGTEFGTWRLLSYTAGTSGSTGSVITAKPVAYQKASNDNISNAIFSPAVGTTDMVVETVSNIITTGANDRVDLPAGLKLGSGNTLSIGSNDITISGGELKIDGTTLMKSTALATVATTGEYSDVTGTPSLASVATSGAYADVTGTPTLATVATSGSYTDLTNQPTTFADLTITGNLVVQGTKTELDVSTLEVEDINITMAKGSASATASNNAGITVEGPTADATILYQDNPEKWVFNKTPYFNTNRILTSADEGTGNGLDADTLDGQEGSHYLDYSNFTNTPSATTKADLDIDHLITLSGVSAAADDLGTFSGSTIADSSTIKASLQALETAVEAAEESTSIATNTDNIGRHQLTLGTNAGDTDIGNFSGSTISDGGTVKAGMQELETKVEVNDDNIDDINTAVGTSLGGQNIGTFTGSTISDNGTVKAGMQELETAVETKIASLADDSTPELGGHLDAKSSEIQSSTGTVKLGDNTLVDGTTFANGTLTVNGNATFAHNVAITGQLLVNGSNTIINATTLSVDDALIQLGGDTAPSSDDNKDRGMLMRYHTGSAADQAFVGWDDSEGKMRMMKGVSVSGEVVSGDSADLMIAGVTASGTVNANALEVQGTALANQTKADLDVDHLITLSGVSAAADDLGTFSGSTIADSQTIKTALQSLETLAESLDGEKDDLITLSGVVQGDGTPSVHLSTFTGSTISNNGTIKAGMQELETAVETKLATADHTKASLDVDHLITLSGVADASDNLGTFAGGTIADNETIKGALQDLETAVEAAEESSNINSVYTGALGLSAGDAHYGTFTGSTISDNGDSKEIFQELETAVETKLNSSGAKAALDVDHLITLSGVSAASDNLGTFSGSTISDNVTVKAAIQALETAVEAAEETAAEFNVDHIITLTGVASASDHLGTFSGSTISDNVTIKAAIQALETAVEAAEETQAEFHVDHLVTLSGVAQASDHLGTFTGSTIADNETLKGALQDLETALELNATLASDETITGNYTFDELITGKGIKSSGSDSKVTVGATTNEGSQNLVMSAGENIHFLSDRNANDGDGSICFHFNDTHNTSLAVADAFWTMNESGKFTGKNATSHMQFTSWTSTERDNGSFSAGAVIFNSTTSKLQVNDGSNWVDLH